MEGLLLRPPNFDASKKYPMLLLIHGGPQGAWGRRLGIPLESASDGRAGICGADDQSARLDGLRPKFMAEISGDWGGKVVTKT